jgi:hypothetical protein
MNGYLIIPGIVNHLSTKLQKCVRHDHLGQDTEVKLIEFLTQGMQQENHQQCSCMPHIHTTALMSMRQSTYKDVTVSIALFLLHCSWFCSTIHASCFNTTKPLICSYQRWIFSTLALQLRMRHL